MSGWPPFPQAGFAPRIATLPYESDPVPDPVPVPAIVPVPAGVAQVPVTVVETLVLTVAVLMYLSTSVAISFARFSIAVSVLTPSFWFFAPSKARFSNPF